MLKRLVAVMCLASVSACGVAYVPSSVSRNSENVRVIPLNFESVLIANRQSYNPKQLPSVFYQSGGAVPVSVPPARGAYAGTLRVPPNVDPGPYRLGVGDVLTKNSSAPPVIEVNPAGLKDTSQIYRVQEDGAISVPEVGRISVAGLTPEEAEAALFQRLVENQSNPNASLEILEFNSQNVSVGGTVSQAGVIPITTKPLYLDQALSAAGGVSALEPDYVTIRIFRDGVRYEIPMNHYLTRASLQKLRLIDGDSIFVDTEYDTNDATARTDLAKTQYDIEAANREEARKNFETRKEFDAVDRDYAYVVGEAANPGRFELPFGRHANLADALYTLGGYKNETANPSQIYVLRGSPDPADFGAVTAWHLNARDASNFVVATRMQLRPNDIVFIAEQPITKWNRVVQQLVPSLITYGATVATQ